MLGGFEAARVSKAAVGRCLAHLSASVFAFWGLCDIDTCHYACGSDAVFSERTGHVCIFWSIVNLPMVSFEADRLI